MQTQRFVVDEDASRRVEIRRRGVYDQDFPSDGATRRPRRPERNGLMSRRLLLPLLFLSLLAQPAFAAAKVALFDMAHGQHFTIDGRTELDLGTLGDLFAEGGFTMKTLKEPCSEKSLAGASVLIISGAFARPTNAEVKAILDFVEKGGSLAVMLHIAPPLMPLAGPLGVMLSPGILMESQNLVKDSPQDFSVKSFAKHPLVAEIEEFQVYGGWALAVSKPPLKPIAATSKAAWVDLDHDKKRHPEGEPQNQYAVIVGGDVGKGRVLFFGDDAIFQNRFIVSHGNKQLAKNLIAWFAGPAGK